MTDPRFTKLANLLINYSTRVKKGDRVLLDMTDVPDEMSVELLRAVRAAGGTPLIDVRHSRVTREILRGTDDQHASLVRELELARMKKMQVYIAIRGADNMSENSDVPSDRLSLYSKIIRPVLDHRVYKTRWCVLRWPTPSMAQAAGMSTEAFENLYFDVCTMDYCKMARAMIPLQKRMLKADRVHIKSPGTDLKFSIKNIGAKMCDALDYAHNKRDARGRPLELIHRDVSPQNVLVSFDGNVKLIDFGIAKAASKSSKTQAGILKGKFGYMSPEQVRGMPLDRRSDVFSLGVVLFETLVGQRLFQGDTDFATLEMVRTVDVPAPSSKNPEIPKDLEAIIMKALSGEPETRYQTAMELHDELQAFMFQHGMFYSRKDLAAWMRKQYAREIELEKDKNAGKAPPPKAPPIPNLQPAIESGVNHHHVPGKFIGDLIRKSKNL